jgi:hypothetical protein
MAEIYSALWTEDASGNNAPSPNGWPGSTVFPDIPPIGREMMGAIKREWDLSHPTMVTGGNGNQVTLTPASPVTGYVHGQIFAAVLNADLGATGGATRTLSVSGLTGKKLYMPALAGGFTQTSVSGGEVKAGQGIFFYYDSTLDTGSGGFVIYSILAVPKALESIEIPLTTENGVLVDSPLTYDFVFRMPFDFKVTGGKTSLKVAQASGTLVNVSALMGSSDIFYQGITIDLGETTSVTAAIPTILNDTDVDSDDQIAVRFSGGDTVLRGLKFCIIGYQR